MKHTSEIQWLRRLLPGVILVLYAWFILAQYSAVFEWDLTYREPQIPVAPEDVFGIGFVLPWGFFTLLFLLALGAALKCVNRRLSFVLVLLVLFCALSGIDLFLFERWEREVLTM